MDSATIKAAITGKNPLGACLTVLANNIVSHLFYGPKELIIEHVFGAVWFMYLTEGRVGRYKRVSLTVLTAQAESGKLVNMLEFSEHT